MANSRRINMSVPALVQRLASPDNDLRREAEGVFGAMCEQKADEVAAGFVNILVSGGVGANAQMLRAFSAVLLRRLVERRNDFWGRLSPAARARVQDGVVAALAAETEAHICRKLCHVVAELAATLVRAAAPAAKAVGAAVDLAQVWPAVLPAVLALSRASDARRRAVALNMFGQLSTYVGAALTAHGAALLGVFQAGLADPALAARVAALKATCAYLIVIAPDDGVAAVEGAAVEGGAGSGANGGGGGGGAGGAAGAAAARRQQQRAAMAPFQATVPAMMKALEAALNGGDEAAAQDALGALVEICEVSPRFLRPFAGVLGQAMVSIARAATLATATRCMAVEFLLTLAENASGMVRKERAVVAATVAMALALLCEAGDEPNAQWAERPESAAWEEGEDGRLACVGEEAVDRIARALGAKAVLPVAFAPQHIPALAADPDWRRRRAALLATGLAAEGCRLGMRAHLPDIVRNLVVPRFGDPHPRVRHAACHCVSQLAADFGTINCMNGVEHDQGAGAGQLLLAQDGTPRGNFQRRFHKELLPPLVAMLQGGAGAPNHGWTRVRAHAASALIHFCAPEQCAKEFVRPCLEPMLRALFDLVSGTGVAARNPAVRRSAQEEALTCLACVARTVERDFAPHYGTFMPLAKQIMAAPACKENRMLRARAMECIGLMGEAVGAQTFAPDAKAVMDTLLRSQAQGFEPDDDKSAHYVQQTCARICRVMGGEFVRYLPLVIPPLCAAATREVEMNVIEIARDEEGNIDEGAMLQDAGIDVDDVENGSVSLLSIGGGAGTDLGQHVMTINTAALQDKSNACHMLFTYAEELGVHFFPYVERVATVMFPLVNFQFHEGVRLAAACVLPRLLKSMLAGLEKRGQSQAPAQAFVAAAVVPVLKGVQQRPPARRYDELCMYAETLSDLLAACLAHTGTLREATAAGKLPLLPVGVPAAGVGTVLVQLGTALQLAIEDRVEMDAEARADEDFDEEAEEALQAEFMEIDEFIMKIADNVGCLLKAHGAAMYPAFEEKFLPLLQTMLAHRHVTLRHTAMCSFDDVIEHAGPASRKLVPALLPAIAQALAEQREPQLQQAAAYGVAVCAAFAGPEAMPTAAGQGLLQALVTHVLQQPRPTDEHEGAYANAVSAALTLAMHRPDCAPPAQVLPAVLGWLPVRYDEEEARSIHKRLLMLAAAGNGDLLGANKERLPRVLAILADAIAACYRAPNEDGFDGDEEVEELVDGDTTLGVARLFDQLKMNLQPQAMEKLWQQLNPPQQKILTLLVGS